MCVRILSHFLDEKATTTQICESRPLLGLSAVNSHLLSPPARPLSPSLTALHTARSLKSHHPRIFLPSLFQFSRASVPLSAHTRVSLTLPPSLATLHRPGEKPASLLSEQPADCHPIVNDQGTPRHSKTASALIPGGSSTSGDFPTLWPHSRQPLPPKVALLAIAWPTCNPSFSDRCALQFQPLPSRIPTPATPGLPIH